MGNFSTMRVIHLYSELEISHWVGIRNGMAVFFVKRWIYLLCGDDLMRMVKSNQMEGLDRYWNSKKRKEKKRIIIAKKQTKNQKVKYVQSIHIDKAYKIFWNDLKSCFCHENWYISESRKQLKGVHVTSFITCVQLFVMHNRFTFIAGFLLYFPCQYYTIQSFLMLINTNKGGIINSN